MFNVNPAMIDLIQLQEDLYGLLMSAPQLATVNIVQERKFILDQQLQVDAIWQTLRNGCQGCGILIEMPSVEVDSNNVSGPPQTVELSFVSFQNGDTAFIPSGPGGPAGAGLFAEQIEQFLVDILHLQNLQGIGTMTARGAFSSPARDYPLINARRTKFVCTPKQTAQTPRTAAVQVSINTGLATLSSTTPGAAIWYTMDGSFPSNNAVALDPLSHQPVNPGSQEYTSPIPVATGQTLRAAAYANGLNLGPVLLFTVP